MGYVSSVGTFLLLGDEDTQGGSMESSCPLARWSQSAFRIPTKACSSQMLWLWWDPGLLGLFAKRLVLTCAPSSLSSFAFQLKGEESISILFFFSFLSISQAFSDVEKEMLQKEGEMLLRRGQKSD